MCARASADRAFVWLGTRLTVLWIRSLRAPVSLTGMHWMSDEGALRFFHFHAAVASGSGEDEAADDDAMSDEEPLPRCPVCKAEIHFMRHARSIGSYGEPGAS